MAVITEIGCCVGGTRATTSQKRRRRPRKRIRGRADAAKVKALLEHDRPNDARDESPARPEK
jgi:hypothetical protein